ncbi:Hsp20/alpha crystallin family protein [Mycobacterium tuberculosis]|nr:Hsp20/alpha crystallin family protein [Mycobacterium tuberculosis]
MGGLTLWQRDPFTEFDALVRRAFAPYRTDERFAGFIPSAEVVRDGQDAVVNLDLPGLDPAADVAVEVESGRLVVRGERRDERTGERGRREVRYGSFRREFVLPEHVTADDVTADYEAGVLKVRVAGAFAETQPRRVAVTVGGSPAVTEGEDTAGQDA